MPQEDPTLRELEEQGRLTFLEYSRRAESTAIYPFSKIPASHAMLHQHGMERAVNYCLAGLANESGEALGKFKKALRDEIKEGPFAISDERRQVILDEIGDALWYQAEACRQLGSSLEEVAARNLAKLSDRASRGALGGSGDKR